jgi:hypothetical protein
MVIVAAAAAVVAGTLDRDQQPGTVQVAHGHIFAGRHLGKT